MTNMQTYNSVKEVDVKKLDITNKLPRFHDFFSGDEGGIPWGRTIYVTGSSGAGKTTFFVMLQSYLENIKTALYEIESPAHQIKSRNSNLNLHANCVIEDKDSCSSLTEFLANATATGVKMIIVDSLQVVARDFMEAANHSKDRAEEMAYTAIIEWTQKTNGISFIIGHVTKEDGFAGKNTIMQMMDAHLEMIFDRTAGERFMRFGQKNRDGSVGDKIYYTFNGQGRGIKLHTPEEWAIIHKKTEIDDYLFPIIKGYIDAFKHHSKFKVFKNEFWSFHDEAHEIAENEGSSQGTFMGQLIDKISELTSKNNML